MAQIREVRTQPQDQSTMMAAAGTSSLLSAAALAGVVALFLRRPENRACMAQTVNSTMHDVGDVLGGAGSSLLHGTRRAAGTLMPAAQHSAGAVAHAAKPVSGILTGGTGALLARGVGMLMNHSDEEEHMHKTDYAKDTAKTLAREARHAMQHGPSSGEIRSMIKKEIDRQLSKQFDRHERRIDQQLQQNFSQHDAALHSLADQLDHLTVNVRTKRGGGIPWTLLLVAGAGYYLWRNPQARQQVMDKTMTVAEQVGAKENLQKAGESLRQGVESARNGENPAPALRDAVNQGKEAGQKAVSNVQEKAQQAKQQGQEMASNMGSQGQGSQGSQGSQGGGQSGKQGQNK